MQLLLHYLRRTQVAPKLEIVPVEYKTAPAERQPEIPRRQPPERGITGPEATHHGSLRCQRKQRPHEPAKLPGVDLRELADDPVARSG